MYSIPTQSGVRHSLMRTNALYWSALLLLCSAYLVGGLNKLFNFPSAIEEMHHFGMAPAVPFAIASIIAEIGASALILIGYFRWLGALTLAAFTLFATLIAYRFWELTGVGRFSAENTFFEHLGLAGAFFLVAIQDLKLNFMGSTNRPSI